MNGTVQEIEISALSFDGLQVRGVTVEEVVADYANAMKDGEDFPPVTVFTDGKTNYLADGFHRVAAAEAAGREMINAIVLNGSYRDAKLYAARANARNGLRMTNEMKRNCIQSVWDDRRRIWGDADPSAELLAKTCGCGTTFAQEFITSWVRNHPAVGRLTTPPPVRKVIGADGRTRTAPPPPVRNHPAVGRLTTPPPSRPPVKKGYYIGADGRTHADGVLLDRFGVEIPQRLAHVFANTRLDDLAASVSEVKCEIEREQKAGAFWTSNLQRCMMQLSDAYHELKAARPFCVCRMCQGQGCQACADAGFQTQDQYNRNPSEFKA